jgi:hypothetical protein
VSEWKPQPPESEAGEDEGEFRLEVIGSPASAEQLRSFSAALSNRSSIFIEVH